MARYIDNDNTEVFRAVVTTTYADDRYTSTNSYGPFISKGAATAVVNKAKREAEFHNNSEQPYKYPLCDIEVEGYVERAQLRWERVDG